MTKMISWGNESMSIKPWAAKYGYSPRQLHTLKLKHGTWDKVFAHLDSHKKGTKNAAVYTYTGPDFTAPNGAEIKKGTKATLAGYAELTGIKEATIRTRMSKSKKKNAINRAINSPVGKFVPECGAMKRRGDFRNNPELAPAKNTLQIINCRRDNPGKTCAGCFKKNRCYPQQAAA